MHTQEEEGIHQITGRGSRIVSNWNSSPKRKCNRYKNIALYLGQKQLHKYAVLQLQAVQGRKRLEGFRHLTLTVVNYSLSRGEQKRETIQDHFTWGTVKGTHKLSDQQQENTHTHTHTHTHTQKTQFGGDAVESRGKNSQCPPMFLKVSIEDKLGQF